ncbi:uncharacterized protein FOBCDRAFT_33934 [Fusarium oxysporum Fo47]|uniref:uncharacterized protein n=1 Tax=Fusarium oxysporum Fo47 TaxID=660027 RepID=UPI002869B969|nr:uncharacterized protein FOBCDRAFT_33934 [Fusarium oxysporum Fo47]WJG35313.1 hypothetical protein FOBCDRAFT_33934 [Fusarium oxysporum Fo47]
MKQTPFECLRCTDFAVPRLISPLMQLGKSSSLCPSGKIRKGSCSHMRLLYTFLCVYEKWK